MQSAELIQAREAASGLLDDLGLSEFLFDVEPDGGRWAVYVECASEQGWAAVTLPVLKERLLASQSDRTIRQQIAGQWRDRLGVCRLNR